MIPLFTNNLYGYAALNLGFSSGLWLGATKILDSDSSLVQLAQSSLRGLGEFFIIYNALPDEYESHLTSYLLRYPTHLPTMTQIGVSLAITAGIVVGYKIIAPLANNRRAHQAVVEIGL